MSKKWILNAALAVAIMQVGSAAAQEANAKLKSLPPAVQRAVETEAKGATIKGVSKEVENGKSVYEVETLVAGRTRDMVFAADGALLVVEEQSSLEAIPAAARSAIEKQATGGRVTTVEVVKKGTNVSYEAVVVKAGRKSEVVVNADGTAAK